MVNRSERSSYHTKQSKFYPHIFIDNKNYIYRNIFTKPIVERSIKFQTKKNQRTSISMCSMEESQGLSIVMNVKSTGPLEPYIVAFVGLA